VIIRFKDEVPLFILIPHVAFMFFAVLIGMRTGMAALFAPGNMRRLAWVTLGIMTIGGMILGPIVQKYAFGAFWTGFPFGYDLTDNKVLIMWVLWLVACALIGFKPKEDERTSRRIAAVAALVMLVVYIIPHSAQGSELDYEALERGVPASEAIRTGGQRN
jgi:FtsH-binding integral membrane protein